MPWTLETARLTLRLLTLEDAAFLVKLLNEPDFLRFIGDRKVRTEDDARRYLTDGPFASYEQHGFGMYLVEERRTREKLGLCGLVRRPGLSDVDVGFAFLEPFRRAGYAFESAQAVLRHAHQDLGIGRVVAIANFENEASTRLLEKLGLRSAGPVTLPGSTEVLNLFVPV